jgi:hypothetical protein
MAFSGYKKLEKESRTIGGWKNQEEKGRAKAE